jgi:hypothetical protein
VGQSSKKNTADLIDELVGDLQAVKSYPNSIRLLLVWLPLSFIGTAAVMLMYGPYRPAAISQLLEAPRFLLEVVLGVATVASGSYLAFELAIPELKRSKFLFLVPATLFVSWMALLAFSLFSPAIEPSMVGKREHCLYEVLVYGSALFFVATWLQKKGLVLDRTLSYLCTGLAAAAIPAILMHVACMYEPYHVLSLHIAPFIGVAVVGSLLSYVFSRK